MFTPTTHAHTQVMYTHSPLPRKREILVWMVVAAVKGGEREERGERGERRGERRERRERGSFLPCI